MYLPLIGDQTPRDLLLPSERLRKLFLAQNQLAGVDLKSYIDEMLRVSQLQGLRSQ